MEIKECYRVLEVEIGASREAVETAYCRLLERWHPDRVTPAGDPAAISEAARMVQAVNEAYQTLVKIAPATGTTTAPFRTKPALGALATPATLPVPVRPTFAPFLPQTPATIPPAPPLPPPAPPPVPEPPPPPAPTPETTLPEVEPIPPAPTPAAAPAEKTDHLAKAKTFYNQLLPVGSPQRKYGPLIVAAPVLIILILAKCAVSSVSEKITEVSQAHAEAKRVQTTGVLVVKSNRPEATVEATRIALAGDTALDHAKGALNQALPGLTPGKYTVTAHVDGWPDVQGEANVSAGNTTEVALNFKGGSLRVDSDPAGAMVQLAGAVLGKTPLVVPELPPGDCQLTLDYPGFPAVSVKATIRESAESAANVRLPYGKLIVESMPAGATVLLGTRAVGQTPLTLDRVPAGTKKITLQAANFPPLEISAMVGDRGEVKINRELGFAFPELDPATLLRAIWVADDPSRLAPSFDTGGQYEPRNGVVKNLNRKRLYVDWLNRKYHYSAIIKSYDPASGKIEFAEQKNDWSKYRVLTELSVAARNDKDVAALLAKGATLTFYGKLDAVEEPRWPGKVITFEISAAEILH